MVDAASMLKNATVKSANKYLWVFKHASLFIQSLGAPLQHPNSSDKLLVLAVHKYPLESRTIVRPWYSTLQSYAFWK